MIGALIGLGWALLGIAALGVTVGLPALMFNEPGPKLTFGFVAALAICFIAGAMILGYGYEVSS